ncbi:hypothetical protein [Campylobacter sp. 19-13652]|uniref:hypothetical protein n=1 Tax=Campylobacter sp. 19-13652 TaxID=2840180 RepID=UPI001C75DE8B|nr:hypothetical protein [Campylobacter sp. 19-13652]BCX79401.1 hypothetical protein LBC_08630 [Campylobacter sp. 19-13652]
MKEQILNNDTILGEDGKRKDGVASESLNEGVEFVPNDTEATQISPAKKLSENEPNLNFTQNKAGQNEIKSIANLGIASSILALLANIPPKLLSAFTGLSSLKNSPTIKGHLIKFLSTSVLCVAFAFAAVVSYDKYGFSAICITCLVLAFVAGGLAIIFYYCLFVLISDVTGVANFRYYAYAMIALIVLIASIVLINIMELATMGTLTDNPNMEIAILAAWLLFILGEILHIFAWLDLKNVKI